MTNPAGADPTSYLLDGWDGVLFGAGSGGISGLQSLSQEAVMIAKQAAIEGNVVLQTILSLIFTGLRDGIPLALSIIEGLAVKLLGLIPGFTTVEEALDAIGQVPLVVDIVQALTGVANGTLTDIESWATALGIGLSDAAALVQAAIDAIAQALGHPGTGHTPADLLVYVANIPGDAVSGVTRDWGTALAALQLPNPLALIQQIPQSIPALVRGPDGALTPVGTGFTKDAEGAITFVSDGLTHLVKQADGAILSIQQVGGQIVHATNVVAPTPGSGVADVMDAGQTAHTALTGVIEKVGVTVEGDIVAGANALGDVVSGTAGQIEDAAGVFAGDVAAGVDNLGAQAASWMSEFASLWAGAPPPPPPSGPPPPSRAMLAAAAEAAAAQALAAQQTAAINAQLPHFYGGSGTAGTTVEQGLAGLTSLPAGFASVSTIASVSAMYSTAAQTSSQTTSGIWSTSDQYAKYLFLRMNAAGTSYVYAKIQNNVPFTGAANCEIGCVVAGSRHIFATFALPSTGNLVSNNVYTFEGTGNVFQLTGPGGLNESYTDGTMGGSPSVSQWDPDNTTHVYGYGGWGGDGTLLGQTAFTAPGTYNVPAGMVSGDIFDLVEAAGGGGGNEDDFAGHLRGGGLAGAWSTQRLTWGTDFSTSTTAFAITPGAGGTGALSPGATSGGNSTIAITGWASSPLTATGGGTTSAGVAVGATASNQTFQNVGYLGGAGSAAIGEDGAIPGGGGFGSGIAFTNGAGGKIWVNACSLNAVGSLYSWAFYDSGPSAGPGGAEVDTDETTSSATYGQLTTTTDQIEVNVGDRGMVQVFLGAEFYNTSASHYAYMSFALSGANTATAAAMESLGKFIKNGSNSAKFGEPLMVYNLAKGPTTFETQYRTDGTGTGHFAHRSIDAIPL